MTLFEKQKTILEENGYEVEDFLQKSFNEKDDILYNLQEEYFGKNKPVNSLTPLVSVCIITYNQEKYIRDCLDGVLMQRTDFPIEIVLCDDGSNDNTPEICRDYADKHPNKIRLFNRIRSTSFIYDENGKFVCGQNLNWAIRAARGKYMALCEGDDYWIDAEKLQRQVDYMVSHPECSACWTDGYELYPDGSKKQYERYLESGITSIEDIIMKGGIWIPTASLMIRRKGYDKWPPDGTTFHIGDYPMQVHVADIGQVYYFKDPMVVYRVQSQGSWTSSTFANYDSLERYYALELSMLDNLKKHTSDKCQQYLDQLIRLRLFQRIKHNIRNKRSIGSFLQYLRTYYAVPKKYRPKHAYKVLLKAFF